MQNSSGVCNVWTVSQSPLGQVKTRPILCWVKYVLWKILFEMWFYTKFRKCWKCDILCKIPFEPEFCDKISLRSRIFGIHQLTCQYAELRGEKRTNVNCIENVKNWICSKLLKYQVMKRKVGCRQSFRKPHTAQDITNKNKKIWVLKSFEHGGRWG